MKTQSDVKIRFVIIMAGGRDGRFWPVNRQKDDIRTGRCDLKKNYPGG
jgi:hypothetical protein